MPPVRQNTPARPVLSIAPMLDLTDRHFRYFMRLITRRTLLYSEMVVTTSILRGDKKKLLDFSPEELPLALQLGGDNPAELAECAKIGQDWGYSEINLNVGCPSDRVQQGSFGACLMASPELIARCVERMKSATTLPVTVKHRLGIDDRQEYHHLREFVSTVAAAGCDRVIVHARIAVLRGLSPKDNRRVPPLRYDWVYRLKQEFPHLVIELNGGIINLDQAREHLGRVDGVMIGRAAYDDPYLFAQADSLIFGEERKAPSREQIVEQMADYVRAWQERGVHPRTILRHMLGLFRGQPGARRWRRFLSEQFVRREADADVLLHSLRIFGDGTSPTDE